MDPNEMVNSLADVVEKETDAQTQTQETETATAEAEKPAETVAEAAETPPEPAEKQRVPLAELIEERKRAREAERQLREMQSIFIQAANKRQEQEKRAQEQAKPSIKFEDSPIDYLKAEVEETKKTAAQLREEKKLEAEQRTAREQQEANMRQFRALVRNDEAKFVAAHPDYYEALSYMREMTKLSLEEYDMSPDEMVQHLQTTEFNQALAAVQRNKSPAETVYKIAKKLGYKPAAVETAQKTGTTQTTDQIEQLKRKQAAAKNPTSSGLPTVDDLTDMPTSEFDAAFAAAFGKK